MNMDTDFPTADHRLASLERQVRVLRLALVAMALSLGAMALSAFGKGVPEVTRTRGIIIEDSQGRERILIGAPIPASRTRVRTDTARVRQVWSRRFPNPDQYMGYYANYRHSMHGMLVLDEHGFDRLAIGDSTPDPNIGRRIGPGTGIQINDGQGFERSGYGLLSVDGRDRVVLGLDSRRGTEGLALSLFDDGQAGLSVFGAGGSVAFFGSAPPDMEAGQDSLFGLLIRDRTGTIHRLSSVGQR